MPESQSHLYCQSNKNILIIFNSGFPIIGKTLNCDDIEFIHVVYFLI